MAKIIFTGQGLAAKAFNILWRIFSCIWTLTIWWLFLVFLPGWPIPFSRKYLGPEANTIFTGQGFRHIVENIFLHLDFDDLVAVAGKKGGCELINKWCHEILKNPNFWLKKWTKNGLTSTDQMKWIKIFDLAKITNQEEDVLKFIKKVIQRRHFVSVPCFIKENDLARFLNLPKTPDQVHLAMDEKNHGIIQIMAPWIMKSPNALNRDGNSPIIWATKEGSNKEIVKILAPLMVNPNTPDTNGSGYTPIHYAAENYADVEIVQFLASLTDNPNAPAPYSDSTTPCGLTPIHYAAMSGKVDVIRCLAPLVDNPNPQGMFGETPMHYAAMFGNVDVIRCLAPLVDNPNPLNTLSNRPQTPIDYATRAGHQEVVDILNEYVYGGGNNVQ